MWGARRRSSRTSPPLSTKTLRKVFPLRAAGLIALILLVLLRSVLAPVVLLLSVGLCFAATLGASTWSSSTPWTGPASTSSCRSCCSSSSSAIGTDYNILISDRIREEMEARAGPGRRRPRRTPHRTGHRHRGHRPRRVLRQSRRRLERLHPADRLRDGPRHPAVGVRPLRRARPRRGGAAGPPHLVAGSPARTPRPRHPPGTRRPGGHRGRAPPGSPPRPVRALTASFPPDAGLRTHAPGRPDPPEPPNPQTKGVIDVRVHPGRVPRGHPERGRRRRREFLSTPGAAAGIPRPHPRPRAAAVGSDGSRRRRPRRPRPRREGRRHGTALHLRHRQSGDRCRRAPRRLRPHRQQHQGVHRDGRAPVGR
ncbi:hypothetical protein SCALM49S_03414 [Streptomyces californicus]